MTTQYIIKFLLLLKLCMCSFVNLTAQQTKLINHSDSICEFGLLNMDHREHKKNNKAAIDRHYWWYRWGEIHRTQGDFAGRLLHGIFKVYTPEKQLKVAGFIKHGLKHGQWKFWDESGNLIRMEHWRNGRKVKTTSTEPKKKKHLFKRKNREKKKPERLKERKKHNRKRKKDSEKNGQQEDKKVNKQEGKQKNTQEDKALKDAKEEKKKDKQQKPFFKKWFKKSTDTKN